MRVRRASTLPCSADTAWAAVQNVSLLAEVAAPLITFAPDAGESLPQRWPQGGTVSIRSYLFGIIPLGLRSLRIEHVDPVRREVQTRERDPLIRRWDHRIAVADAGPGRCLYTDEVEIDAGVLTLPVWLFARLFFRHRHRRWRGIAARLGRDERPVASPGLS